VNLIACKREEQVSLSPATARNRAWRGPQRPCYKYKAAKNGKPGRETTRDLNLTGNSRSGLLFCGQKRFSRVSCYAGRSIPLHTLRNEIRVWTRDLLIAIGLALVIIVFLYQPVKVEGTSMAPLLSDQERIFINKFVYRFEPIQRGDVVVFWYPLDHSKIVHQARCRFAR